MSDPSTLLIFVAPRARVQLLTIDEWWRTHRLDAPELVQLEFAEALEQLRSAPETGALFDDLSVPGMRRVLLARTRYHVYYVVDERRTTVKIMAVWHTSRGRGPVLR